MLLAMARAMYKEWLDKDKLVLLQGWKREHIQIGQALKRGREEINIIVENALLKKALSGNTTAMIFFLKNNWRDKYNDSQLSKEERELVLANIRKAKADARIKEAKAIVAERLGTEDNEQLDQVLNKLIEEAEKVGTDKSTNEETD